MKNQLILHNVRILDFTWVLAGPYATRLLADFGAEVIKVQPLLSSETDDAFSRGYYDTWNRNKLGVTLDLNKPEGIAIAKKLIALSDAVVENFTPRVMANWGLDYKNVRKISPDIIMVRLSLMGHKGPWRNFSGYGPSVHAFSGMTGLTSFPGGPPLGPGFSYADHVAGLYASMSLLGALEERRRTGRGRHIDISEVGVMRGLLEDSLNGQKLEPAGNSSQVAAPHGVYPCRDNRWYAIAVFTDDEWCGFKHALGDPAWAEGKKFSGLPGRIENKVELDRLVGDWTRRHTAGEVISKLRQNGVPAGIVQDAAGLAVDPQLKARGFFVSRPELGRFVDATPIKLSETPSRYNRPAPPPGRDNDFVYGELLGLSRAELARLKKNHVI